MDWDWGLILTVISVVVAGVAAVVGLWMERDQERPPRWAVWLTVLIILATGVTVATGYSDSLADDERDRVAEERYVHIVGKADALQAGNEQLQQAAEESKEREEKMADDMARVLLKLNEMAGTADDPTLQAFVKNEMTAQSRANEEVVTAVAQRVADKGDDPDTVLANFLPEEEMQRVKRNVKKKEERMAKLLEKREARKAGKAEAGEEPTRGGGKKDGKKDDKDGKKDDKDKNGAADTRSGSNKPGANKDDANKDDANKAGGNKGKGNKSKKD